jgi:hypothetical protein
VARIGRSQPIRGRKLCLLRRVVRDTLMSRNLSASGCV